MRHSTFTKRGTTIEDVCVISVFITFLDSDIILPPVAVENLAEIKGTLFIALL